MILIEIQRAALSGRRWTWYIQTAPHTYVKCLSAMYLSKRAALQAARRFLTTVHEEVGKVSLLDVRVKVEDG